MLEIGQTVGNYRIVRKIDEGGMGAVYEGVHDQIDRHVAIKVLHADLLQDSQFVRRLANEARAVNIIKHPGIVEISDFGQIPGGSPYIVMEFLDGESLERRLRRRGKLTSEETALIGYQVASALTAAHAKGIIHRDMKPDNVMLVSLSDGEGERVKILDFGIAKLREEHEQAEQQKAGKLTQQRGRNVRRHFKVRRLIEVMGVRRLLGKEPALDGGQRHLAGIDLRQQIIGLYINVLAAEASARLQDTILVTTTAQLALAQARLHVGRQFARARHGQRVLPRGRLRGGIREAFHSQPRQRHRPATRGALAIEAMALVMQQKRPARLPVHGAAPAAAAQRHGAGCFTRQGHALLLSIPVDSRPPAARSGRRKRLLGS